MSGEENYWLELFTKFYGFYLSVGLEMPYSRELEYFVGPFFVSSAL